MDATLHLKNKPNVIGATADFTYHWGLHSGLDHVQASRLAVAVSELVTDVVLFAFGDKDGEMNITFQRHLDIVEVIVHELGEPFNPDRHPYDPERAIREGDFEGAGFELVRKLTDDFIYINLGRQGKEFRLIQKIVAPHIVDLLPRAELKEVEEVNDSPPEYEVTVIEAEDAEDISKLIYRTYGRTYHKENLYFPRKIELAIQQNEKFGVITRTGEGEPTGYFAIVMSTDSNIGEVGEAVVAVPHRRRGLMTRMLRMLVESARERALFGLFGEANAAHLISQRTNAKFGFHSTAVLLAVAPAMEMEGFQEELGNCPVSCIFEFVPLVEVPSREIYPPAPYRDILFEVYGALGMQVHEGSRESPSLPEQCQIEVDINYEDEYALLVVRHYGQDFLEEVEQLTHELSSQQLMTLQIDLPLFEPATRRLTGKLKELGYIFSGLMPFYHQGRDFLRLQRISPGFEFSYVQTFSQLGRKLKNITSKEYHEVQTGKQASRD